MDQLPRPQNKIRLPHDCDKAASARDQSPARAETTTVMLLLLLQLALSAPEEESEATVTESGWASFPIGSTRTDNHSPRGANSLVRFGAAAPQSIVSSTHGPEVPGSVRAFALNRRGDDAHRSRYQDASPGAAKIKIGRSCSAQHSTNSAATGK
jgi:hypothetical protein